VFRACACASNTEGSDPLSPAPPSIVWRLSYTLIESAALPVLLCMCVFVCECVCVCVYIQAGLPVCACVSVWRAVRTWNTSKHLQPKHTHTKKPTCIHAHGLILDQTQGITHTPARTVRTAEGKGHTHALGMSYCYTAATARACV
jgi:hypothetical protein